MCLTYKPLPVPEEKFTAYKVYLLLRGCLLSPHNFKQPNGIIERPGTYSIDPTPAVCGGYSPRRQTPPYVIARRGYSEVTIPIHADYEGWDLDIPGFHVIATKEEAEVYQQYMERQRQEFLKDDTQSADDLEKYAEAEYVVVPVQVNPALIYATGHTPFGDTEGDDRPAHEIKTYVAHEITITADALHEIHMERFLAKPFEPTNWDEPFEDDTPETPNTTA